MDEAPVLLPSVTACPSCNAQLVAGELSCPQCQQLIYAAKLKELAAEAEAHTQAGELGEALARWRSALELLPPETRQFAIVSEKIDGLSAKLLTPGTAIGKPAAPTTEKPAPPKSKLGPFGAIGAALVFILSKAKFLLLGLSKATTLLSMLVAFGVYWNLWGWKFAAGFVLSIYIHEMGHVAALRKFGMAATAPMFIPGVGAFVRLKQYPASPSEDAYVGLAGPIWGLGAACLTGLIYLGTNHPLFAALTHTGALINLFNLMPLGSLDGGRGFRALSKRQRIFATLFVGGAWYLTSSGILLIVLVVAGMCCFSPSAPKKEDLQAMAKYVLLVITLSALVYWTADVTVKG